MSDRKLIEQQTSFLTESRFAIAVYR